MAESGLVVSASASGPVDFVENFTGVSRYEDILRKDGSRWTHIQRTREQNFVGFTNERARSPGGALRVSGPQLDTNAHLGMRKGRDPRIGAGRFGDHHGDARRPV